MVDTFVVFYQHIAKKAFPKKPPANSEAHVATSAQDVQLQEQPPSPSAEGDGAEMPAAAQSAGQPSSSSRFLRMHPKRRLPIIKKHRKLRQENVLCVPNSTIINPNKEKTLENT